MIDENLKLLSGNNELADDEISPTSLPGRPSTLTTKDTNEISDNFLITLLRWHVSAKFFSFIMTPY